MSQLQTLDSARQVVIEASGLHLYDLEMQSGWTLAIGDPTVLGWFTVFAYLTTSVLCGIAGRTASPPKPRELLTQQWYWLCLSGAFLILSVNKQLDLQSLFLEAMRAAAKDYGWYNERRFYQRIFVTALALGSGAILLGLTWMSRRRPPAIRMALFGVTCTCAFVVLRSASSNHVVDLARMGTGFIQLVNWLELAGIGIVAFAAAVYSRGRRPVA
jgi:hypothetical protein